MIDLAKKLRLSPKLINGLEKVDSVRVAILSEKCLSKGFYVLRRHSELMRLAVILRLAVRVKEKYDELGIDEKVYYDTMSDIRLWCTEKGVRNYGWLKNHVTFELFRLGRLQFQFYECKTKALLYNKLPFKGGEKLIYIHIPAGEKLEKEKCLASLCQAESFFSKYFPEYSYKHYFCESWLLYEGNRDFMEEGSNILEFMALFDIRYSVKIDAQAIERIYGKRRFVKSTYPENTFLQRSAKAYMKRGGRLGAGVGVIAK